MPSALHFKVQWALRELIQNAADAVEARRRLESRADDWGEIHIDLKTTNSNHWLTVEDNGTGMSPAILSTILLDFGKSLWNSSQVMNEHPGLLSSGYRGRGQFGIGFFSVFMVGSLIRVCTRRYDQGHDAGVCLEFRSVTDTRPILYSVPQTQIPIDGGTRVEICLSDDPDGVGGLLYNARYSSSVFTLAEVVGKVAPALDVTLVVTSEGQEKSILRANDWIRLDPRLLIARLYPGPELLELNHSDQRLTTMRPIVGPNGSVYGRGFICPSQELLTHDRGSIVVSGLRANRIRHIEGVVFGEVRTITRDRARPIVPIEALAKWATNQGRLIQELYANENQQEYRIQEARVAAVVLSCGGDIGGLKIVKWGSSWFDCHELDQKLRDIHEVVVAVDTQLETIFEKGGPYIDLIAKSFHQSSNTCFIVSEFGMVVWERHSVWPDKTMLGNLFRGYTVVDLIRERIAKVWGVGPQESKSQEIVGVFDGLSIELEVQIYRRTPGPIDDL